MAKARFILPILASLFVSITTFAQSQRVCGAMQNLESKLAEDPTYYDRIEEIERHTHAFEQNGGVTQRAVVTIPVVFHIIHNGDAVGASENITDAQINAQLDQLNKDFRKLNADASSIPSVFAGVAADAEIQFCLAKRTPTGAATTGINRLNMGQASWTMNQIESTLKPQSIWNRDKYLNLWTVIFGGSDAGTLGYAQFPGGTANTDGVVLLYSSVGSTSVPNSAGGAYGKGRTATHEIGHWLNLRHIWGDATCGSDLVSDTPTHNTANYGCPTYPHASTCSGAPTEMTMNYMDYTDDACMYMFSTGQKTRMQALFATGGSRIGLVTSDGCTAPSGGGTTCGTATGLGSSNVAATSATVTWGAVTGASSYNLQYKTSAATTWITISTTATSYSLTGLTASTTYNYQVQAVCSGTSGSYSSASSFTTSASTGGGTCTDAYESNNTSSTAKTVPVNTATTALISTSTDIDWFKFSTTTSSGTRVKVSLTNLPADYDMRLYRGTTSTQVGISQNTGTTSEQIIYNYTSAASYLLKVYGYNGVYNATSCYNLLVQRSTSNFTRLSEEGSEEDLTITKEINENAYDFTLVPNPATSAATLVFNPIEKDELVTITMFDLLGKEITAQPIMLSKGNQAVNIDLTNTIDGIYFVRVAGQHKYATQRLVVRK
ncbi:MAG: T9SS type A sorting domain-containing protein [Saprospiraceae bacterium]|nr:T9SS type A sorting domain-containing protein [Saprospiraceae bacterium]MBP7699285.1 T9SS type A sorting domain-containing protein [Saprospiraceae bacterium]